MIGCKEALCSNCSHLEVCSFKDDFLAAQSAVDKVEIYRQIDAENAISITRLLDIPWIKPVELVCKHYVRHSPQARLPASV